jgi:hypothetical protein
VAWSDKWTIKARFSYLHIGFSLLSHESGKIQAKVLWLLGEMGLEHPMGVMDAVPMVASFCDSEDSLLRERAIKAAGYEANKID